MYSVYSIETGKIRIQLSGESMAIANTKDGEAYALIDCDIDRHIIVDGQAQPAPPTPIDPQECARTLRQYFLESSDWTQVADNQLTSDQRSAWAVYRQQLRDFPQTVANSGATTEGDIEDLLPEAP
jgi:hypothetical protein